MFCSNTTTLGENQGSNLEIVELLYSPDLESSDYNIFGSLKRDLEEWFRAKIKEFFPTVHRWQKCI